jgi:hypothetical protein
MNMMGYANLRVLLTFTLCALASCAQPSGDTQLVPETREGIFYLDFAEAQAVAQAEGKAILLDMWRPG